MTVRELIEVLEAYPHKDHEVVRWGGRERFNRLGMVCEVQVAAGRPEYDESDYISYPSKWGDMDGYIREWKCGL